MFKPARKPWKAKGSYRVKGGTVARIQRNTYPDNWSQLCKEVKQFYNYTCQGCFTYMKTGLEVHHIVPLSRGGTNSKLNLIPLCDACHHKRHKHLR